MNFLKKQYKTISIDILFLIPITLFFYSIFFKYLPKIPYSKDFIHHAESVVMGNSYALTYVLIRSLTRMPNNFPDVLFTFKILALFFSVIISYVGKVIIISSINSPTRFISKNAFSWFLSLVIMASLSPIGFDINNLNLVRIQMECPLFFNVFHNPTIVITNLFVILSFVSMFGFKNGLIENKNFFPTIFFIALQIFFKPAFITGFIGALILFLILNFLIDKNLKNFSFRFGIYLSVSILFLFLYIKFNSYQFKGGGTALALEINLFRHLLDNSMIKDGKKLAWFLVSFSFPMIIFIQTYLNKRNTNFRIWLFFSTLCFVAFCQPLIFAEAGEKLFHNNFNWTSYSTYCFLAPISIATAYNHFKQNSFIGKMPFLFYLLTFISTIPWYINLMR